ncbi:response regulator [Sphingomonas kyeonggiensis]|uniref:DNA-binding NarL/FixJ family response regulator n=1 Tax=Sphingomonas kyeonggiensis TaxID=1268553 RepID=A0A7W6JWT2_9SPHN|nr:response regulator transcription factor [Sphingomonas kyeonggiensis]MBB4099962.1 DNA-binding NarL/FixJ family response regulator [Sphingomonas kyeonggiensis]
MTLDIVPIRVLVVDDHAALRDGIAAIVSNEPDITIAGEAANGEEAIAAYRTLRPDIMLLDLQMPVLGGLEVIKALREEFAGARIVVLTTYEGDVQALRALKAGASGYLLKTSLRKELLEAIRVVHKGRRYVLAEVAQEIAVHAAEDPLTMREVEVLGMVADGNANKVIARRLSLSEDTVKAHLRAIYSKLDVNDRTQAVTVALRRGIIAL